MTQRTRDTNANQRAVLYLTLHADYRVDAEEQSRHGRIGEVDLAIPELLHDGSRKGVDVYLETGEQRGLWRQFIDLHMQRGGVAPERLVAERIEAEYLASLCHDGRAHTRVRR